MTGRSHIACGTSFAVMAGSGIRLIEKKYDSIFSDKVVSFVQSAVYPYLCGFHHMPYLLWWPLAGAAFIFGSLLPDCDSSTSMLGRFLHLPFGHRTWTHTVWFMIPWIVLALFYPLAFYVLAGCLIHMLFDSVSYGGVCWWYPISKYRQYGNGAKVKARHWCRLYRTSETSEAIVDVFLITAAVMTVVLCLCFGIYF